MNLDATSRTTPSPAHSSTRPARPGDDPHELIAEAWHYMDIDALRALRYAEQAKEHATDGNDRPALAMALSAMGRALYYVSEMKPARACAEQALELYRELGDDAGCAATLLTVALASSDDPSRALAVSEQALDYARKTDDLPLQVECLYQLAARLRLAGRKTQADQYFQDAQILAEKSGDPGAISASLQRLGLWHFNQGQYDQAAITLVQARQIADSIGSVRLQGIGAQLLGIVEMNQGRYAEALSHYTAALSSYKKLGSKIWQAQVLLNIGNIHEQLGDYNTALQFWKQAVSLQEIIGDLTGRAVSLQGIGSAYLALNDTENALANFRQSLQLSRDAGYLLGQAEALRWIGETYVKTDDLPQAMAHFLQSVDIHRQLGRRETELAALQNLGEAYHKNGDLQKAGEYYQQCLSLATDIKVPYNQAWILIRMGRLASEQGDQARAQALLSQALQIATDAQTKELIYKAHKALADVCEHREEYQQALKHYRQYNAVREEVFNHASDQRMRNLAVQYEVEKKDREAEISRLKNVELVRLNDELREANRLKNEFLRIAAHDLKNPLAGVMMMTELTMQGLAEDSPITQTQKMVHESSGRMLEIVNRLLDIARLESGAIEIVKERVDMAETVRQVMAQNQGAADAKGQQVETTLEPDCVVQGDAGWLHEAVDNLVSNAVKYTAPGKGIRVEVSATVRDVIVTVGDEGLGLSAEDMKNLFKPFQRLSARPTGGESSTGLGLSIVRQLVELHGGSVQVESQPGQGSRFTIHLPRV